jgi:hypothetical protein
MANLFGKAKAIATTPKAAASKDKKEQVNLDGLEQLAQIDALIKALGTLKSTIETDVKDAAFDVFYDKVLETGKRPDNFRGVEGTASASIELRKRSTTSVVSEEEKPLFEKNGIPLETVVTVQKLFGINPKYASDDNLLEKVSGALDSIVPDDFIVVQEEVSKTVVSEASMDKAFSSKAPKEVIRAISVMAIKPKLETTDLPSIMDDLKVLFQAPVKKD